MSKLYLESYLRGTNRIFSCILWEGANEFEGQFRGLTRWFSWHPRSWGGMHQANCDETIGLLGPKLLGGPEEGVKGR